MKKLLFEVKEWFADAADHVRLLWLDQKIDSLNEESCCEEGEEEGEVVLELYSEARSKVWARIRARETRYYLE